MDDALLQFQTLLPTTLRHKPWTARLALRQHDIPARADLFRAGTPPTRVYFVAKGWVGSSLELTPKNRPLNELHMRGDVIGLASLAGEPSVVRATTLSDVELISASREAMMELMETDPALMAFAYRELCRKLANLALMNAVIGRSKAPERLAVFIYVVLMRARTTFHQQLDTFNLPLTQDEIGQLLGLTNVSVNRAFRKLEEDGILSTGRQSVTVENEAALAARIDVHNWQTLLKRIIAH